MRALTRVADNDNDNDNEAELLAIGLAGTVAQMEKIVRGWRRADRLAATDDPATAVGERLDVHYAVSVLVALRAHRQNAAAKTRSVAA